MWPIKTWIENGEAITEERFHSLALELFSLQFERIEPYRKFCQKMGAIPSTVTSWTRIPAVSTRSFRELELTFLSAAERTAYFQSSGTTDKDRSKNFHNAETLEVYESSLTKWFGMHCSHNVGPALSPTFIFLTPPPQEAPHSSLVHMFGTIGKHYGAREHYFVGHFDAVGGWIIDVEKVIALLEDSIRDQRPVALLGPAFSFVHLLDHLEQDEICYRIPAGSWILETGGYKGRSRTIPKGELYQLLEKRLGVEASSIVSEYGMCELASQAYDHRLDGREASRIFRFPPWARAQIISPETGLEAAMEEVGLIKVVDLANIGSVLAIQTEDLGRRRAGGFELLGRAEPASSRGCSLFVS